jgi:hypothetical protein
MSGRCRELQRAQDRRQFAFEMNIDDGTDDLRNRADTVPAMLYNILTKSPRRNVTAPRPRR